jgi:hypothetical protein
MNDLTPEELPNCKHGDWHQKQVHCRLCDLEAVERGLLLLGPDDGLPPGEDEGLTIEKLASFDPLCERDALQAVPFRNGAEHDDLVWLPSPSKVEVRCVKVDAAGQSIITDGMVNRGVDALAKRHPGIYQMLKSDDPTASLRVVVADILRAALSA